MLQRWPLFLLGAGTVAAVAAAASDARAAQQAASQTWPAFVMVAGLLLIGLVAAEDGLFAAAGGRLASALPGAGLLYVGTSALVVAVTAVLNLDTAVAFITPVVVHTSRRRGDDGVILVSACLLLANAGSLLLPGSNLTNLIVLGGSGHLSGGTFLARMALPWVAAAVVTAAVIGVAGREELKSRIEVGPVDDRPVLGVGLVAVAAAVVLILALSSPAPAVAAVGVVAAGVRVAQGRTRAARIPEVLGLPVLLGLFGLSVGLGALGRDVTGPARALAHLGPWGTAAAGAVATVLINNLPAASLLSARPPAHPLSLLIGLNIGPNLFVSGSLAWVLWHSAARASGGRPEVGRTVRIGLVAAPLAVVAAVAALLVTNVS